MYLQGRKFGFLWRGRSFPRRWGFGNGLDCAIVAWARSEWKSEAERAWAWALDFAPLEALHRAGDPRGSQGEANGSCGTPVMPQAEIDRNGDGKLSYAEQGDAQPAGGFSEATGENVSQPTWPLGIRWKQLPHHLVMDDELQCRTRRLRRFLFAPGVHPFRHFNR